MNDCPSCLMSVSRVLDSRRGVREGVEYVRRRCVCTKCEERWTTYEVASEFFEALLSYMDEDDDQN